MYLTSSNGRDYKVKGWKGRKATDEKQTRDQKQTTNNNGKNKSRGWETRDGREIKYNTNEKDTDNQGTKKKWGKGEWMTSTEREGRTSKQGTKGRRGGAPCSSSGNRTNIFGAKWKAAPLFLWSHCQSTAAATLKNDRGTTPLRCSLVLVNTLRAGYMHQWPPL